MNQTTRDEGAAGEDGVTGRWLNFDREGKPASETITMTREAWLATDPATRPDARLDRSGVLVMLECPIGWPHALG